MSNSESGKEIRSPACLSGEIRKSLLTPCRRLGLPKGRKSNSSNRFKSPLASNEPSTLVSDIPSSDLDVRISTKQTIEVINPELVVLHNKKGKLKSLTPTAPTTNVKDASNTVNAKDNCKKTRKIKENCNTLQNKSKIDRSLDSNCTNVSTSQNSDKDDFNILSKRKRKICIIDSDDEEESFSGFPSSGSSAETSAIDKQKSSSQCSADGLDNNAGKGFNNLKSIAEETEIYSKSSTNIESEKIQTCIKEIGNYSDNKIGKSAELNHYCLDDENKTSRKSLPKPRSNKSVRRKLSLKKSASDCECYESDETFVSSPKEKANCNDSLTDMDKDTMINNIIKLEKAIQAKEVKVDTLRQAHIYRKLHKVEDLRSETDIWKFGLQAALRDLLMKLNEHSVIDMQTLITNLKVPPHLFKYDVENDCFL